VHLPDERAPLEVVRADFDRLARLAQGRWDHNVHYHPELLRHVPPRVRDALDVGCGAGAFSRLLAPRCERLLGVDLSREMVRIARERAEAEGLAHLRFRVVDANSMPLSPESLDLVVSIATLHHLPAEPTLARWRDALRPGGTLLVLDVVNDLTVAGLARSAVAVPWNLALRRWHTGALRDPPELRRAREEHGRTHVYATMADVRDLAARLLPGARVRHHLLWRYSLAWRKPA
jgi:SAM-dependent methyltransferase